jgi:hypothetical protein
MRWDWDYLLHWLGGYAIATAAGILSSLPDGVSYFTWLSMAGATGALGVWGWARERWQERTSKGDEAGPLSLHQWLEATAWPMGGFSAIVAAHLFLIGLALMGVWNG